MPTSYTSLLGLALPVTGELAGTWGDTVNDYITKYLDASVAGTQTISGSQTAVTLSVTNGTTLSQVGSGATGSAQYNIINCTGNPASLLTITAPAASKTYLIINATSTNQSVKIVGTGPTTGVTLIAGEKALVAWNGSDFIKVASSEVDGVSTISFGTTGLTPSTATSGAVTVAGTLVAANGGTGQSSYTTGDLLYATGSTALSKLGIGTNGQILTSTGTAPQWSTLSGVAVTAFSAGTTGLTPNTPTSGAITLGGTLATTNGGTGLTSFTANRVFYASSTSAIGSSANLTFDGTTLTAANFADSSLTSGRVTYATTGGNLTDSANLLFDGTTLTANALTTTSTVTINGGTANGVAYLNGSKVLTSGSALTFDGTNLGVGVSSPSAPVDIQSNSGGTGIRVIGRASANAGAIRYFANDNTTQRARIESNDTCLEINSVANLPMYFMVNNTEAMRLTSTSLYTASGINVGIGTSSPAQKLHVLADTSGALFQGTTLGGITFLKTGEVGMQLFSDATGTLKFYDNNAGATQLTLASGNLGIGTSSPSRRLDVRETENTAVSNSTFWNIAYGGAVINNLSNTANTVSGIGFYGGSAATSISGIGNILESTSLGALGFFTGGSGRSNTVPERMRLDSSGNLGIGTSSPGYKLDVNGTFGLGTGQTGNVGVFGANTATADTYFRIRNTAGAFDVGTAASGHYLYGQGSLPLQFFTNATEGARISSDGTFRVKGAGTAGSTDAVQFAGSAPASALLLDSSGNLGLGGTPTYRLDVFGTGPAFRIKTAAATTGFIVDQNNSNSLVSLINYENAALRFGTNATERAHIPSAGGFVVGTAALATNATTGFLYVPTCAGTPTGTPATQTGTAPIVVDTTNNKLYFYSGGQWRDAGP